ncbi:RNA pseudouridylate synthase domain containing protein 2 [Geranomyces variabilis]|nr:RNA pseudouridylate synthase domain containing protein 2 [Geranomyces variabilis]
MNAEGSLTGPPQSAATLKAEKTDSGSQELVHERDEDASSKSDRPAKRRKQNGRGRDRFKDGEGRAPKRTGRKGLANHETQPLPEIHYYFEKGLRKVEPYPYEYRTYVKGRWMNRSLIETFEKEFQDKSSEYYRGAILSGKITINGQRIEPEYKPRNGDVMVHSIHRHEPPVTADPLEIVHEDDDLLVVNKPSSIPIHPSGRYHHNTMLHILRSPEFGYSNLFPVNRLDRLTSGICFVARNKETAQRLASEFAERTADKTYLCRVRGEFPATQVVCKEPILTVSHKLGINVVSPEGKECSTVFDRLSYNGRTSVVQCKPYSGRTHQIRVHLQYLGYPVANDPIYCCDIWGQTMGKGGVEKEGYEKVIEKLTPHAFPQHKHRVPAAVGTENIGSSADATANGVTAVEDPSTQTSEDVIQKDEPAVEAFTPAKIEGCEECALRRMDPKPEQLRIWLHSWKCQFEGGEEEHATKMPEWAEANYDGDKVLEERFWKFGGKWDGLAAGVVIDDGSA